MSRIDRIALTQRAHHPTIKTTSAETCHKKGHRPHAAKLTTSPHTRHDAPVRTCASLYPFIEGHHMDHSTLMPRAESGQLGFAVILHFALTILHFAMQTPSVCPPPPLLNFHPHAIRTRLTRQAILSPTVTGHVIGDTLMRAYALPVVTLIAILAALICLAPPGVDAAKPNKKDKQPTGASGGESLVPYRIDEKTAPRPKEVAPVDTTLPLDLHEGEHVVFIGNTLFDRAQDFGYFETMMQQAHPDLHLVVRTLAWSADEIDLQPRPDNFGTLEQHLAVQQADVIFAAYGFNESFGGVDLVPAFKHRLTSFLNEIKTRAFNGKTGPRVVLVSPPANENVKGVAAADLNNARLAAYTKAMREVATEQHVGFVDTFTPMRDVITAAKAPLTINGVHFNDAGYRAFAETLYRGVFDRTPAEINPAVRREVLEKNTQFYYRYRPVNSFYYVGGRSKAYGEIDFGPAMERFDIMISNRDKRVWDASAGKKLPEEIDDSNAPPLPPVNGQRPANRWMSPADELAAFKIDPRFEVNCFASEEDFPELAKPIQMRWDARGRLWVSTSQTYPHIYPGNAPVDKIIILEDTDHDGHADTCKTFAEGLAIPLSFEFGDGGVYVSEQPHLTFLKDTDGDDKADVREIVLTGFGTEDSHHALHDIAWTPDGDLIGRESIFLHSQIETPYGPVRQNDSGWFLYRPSEHRLTAFGSYRSTNPWGVTFDDWGNHMASHPNFAEAFHAPNAPYPQLHPSPRGLSAYSGTAGMEFIDMPSFPADMQGGFFKNRYKPTNRVEYHTWTENGAGYEEKYTTDIIFSTNLSFIPVDIRFGPRGAMYVCDWYNPVKGHAQYALRDERRDRKSGRIWRITAKGMPLVDPPKIAGEPIPALLDILKMPEYRYRYWAKRELRERDPAEVKAALGKWLASLDKNDPRYRHHQTEAMWLTRGIDAVNVDLMKELLGCEEHHARAAATAMLRHWYTHVSDAESLLRERANDDNPLVRMEAALTASWIGTPQALAAALDVLKHPTDKFLEYALACSLNSAPMRLQWQSQADAPVYAQVNGYMSKFNVEQKFKEPTPSAQDAQFDAQPDLKKVAISTVPERMLFTLTKFTVKPGQPVKVVMTNPDVTAHNFVIVQPGAIEEVGMAATEMARDPESAKLGYIPKSDKILHHIRMLEQNEIEVLRFKAPEKPGVYPYICTFPGHWLIMRGEMVVK
ncbi:MAG: hypothetical protein GC159_04115 [Phycisphaera sp.]|nr:hypothetical protein [Phycisphaera sp.]